MSAYVPNLAVFIGLTLILGGAGAFAAGRAVARAWRPIALAWFYMIFLAGAVRFLHYALFEENAEGAHALMTYAILALFSSAGFMIERRKQMRRQYPWLSRS